MTYRRDVNTFPGGLREALQQSCPFYVPPGDYYLQQSDGQIVLDASVDMAGDGDVTEIRVRGKPLVGGKGLAKFSDFKISGAQTSDTLLSYEVTTGESPGFEMARINASIAAFTRVADYNDTRSLTIDRAVIVDCYGQEQRHAIDLQGAIRHHEIVNVTLEDFKERGVCVGSGRRTGQLRMESGNMAGCRFRRGIPNASASNNFAFWNGGRNVELFDNEVTDWPGVQKSNGDWHKDNEAAYTKVDVLRIQDLRLIRCGGNLGAWSNKGAHPLEDDWEIDGRDTIAEDVLIDFTDVAGPKTALWLQCYGPCTHAKFKVIAGAGVGYRMHENCNGDYSMREWDVWDHTVAAAPSNPAFVYAGGIGTLNAEKNTLPNTSTTWIRNVPTTLSVTESGQRFCG